MYLKITIFVGFLVAFAAGLMVGKHSTPVVTPTSVATTQSATQPSNRRGPGWISAELQLTPAQDEQAKQIWSNMGSPRERDDERRQWRRDRDAAFISLLTQEQKTKYDEIQHQYDEKSAAAEREIRAKFLANVEKMKAILNPEQRVKYDAMIQKAEADRAARDARDRGKNQQSQNSTTQPATRP